MKTRRPTSHEADLTPGHYINRIARVGNRWIEPRLQKLGLAVAQVPVFGTIKMLGPTTQKELARLLQVEQPTMAQLLTRMQRDGLIERFPDRTDGRSSLISLTQKALQKAEPAREILYEANVIALNGLTPRESATLTSLLRRVLANLERALADSDDEAEGG